VSDQVNTGIHRTTTVDTLALLSRGATRPSRLQSNLTLTRELAVASFKLKYAGSALGYMWSLMRPLMIFGMLYLVFALFLLRGRTPSGENFPVELLVGIIAWTFFAEATSASVSAVVANGEVLRKALFPRWILVVASVISAAMTLAVNFSLIVIVGLALHWYAIGWQTLLVPVLLLELVVLSMGVGMLLASVFVYYRDVGYIWEILQLLLFYASAILFPLSIVPLHLQWVIALNPIAQIVEDMRRALVSSTAPWSSTILGAKLAVPVISVGLTLLVGVVVFKRLARHFGERL
jgi:ABC-2 type transport system permease protein